MIELISCIGSPSDAEAIIDAGADAIYLGYKGQSARDKLVDLSLAQIFEVADIIHKRNKKIYVAFNKGLDNNGIIELKQLLRNELIYKIDAIILADLGALNYSLKNRPSHLQIHSSTNLGALRLSDIQEIITWNVDRIIFSTNLKFEQIKKVVNSCNFNNWEIIIYGGVCFFDVARCPCKYTKGKSTISTFCSYNYGNKTNDIYSFHKPHLKGEMCSDYYNLGVRHFKIEGRTKGRNYLITATSNMRKILDNAV